MYAINKRLCSAMKECRPCSEGRTSVRIHNKTIAQLVVDNCVIADFDDVRIELTFYQPTMRRWSARLILSRLNAVLQYFRVPAIIVCKKGTLYLIDKLDRTQNYLLPVAAWRCQGEWNVGECILQRCEGRWEVKEYSECTNY